MHAWVCGHVCFPDIPILRDHTVQLKIWRSVGQVLGSKSVSEPFAHKDCETCKGVEKN